ncbi:MAG TPA: polymer-forming cytoskeletal protein [Pyrinomonadaceae bacterium]|nr:polymer-forming cytoskeletal protein [Pyrinomonadaceae bacterium]
MTTFAQTRHTPGTGVFDQSSFDDPFAPDAHFGEWFQAVESFRNRPQPEPDSVPPAYFENESLQFEDALSFYNRRQDKISCQGTLVLTEEASLTADVEVTVAMIDGVFKGNIVATKGVVLENHAVVIGDIHTPELTVRGGAIIEGKIRFDARPHTSWEHPRWEALKEGFAKVWRGRIF